MGRKELADLLANGWSADATQLLFTEVPSAVNCAIWQAALARPSDATVLVKSEFCNALAAVSPDGHWLAYRSRVSGRDEIYVERYPELGNRQLVSTDGGTIPIWSKDGREMFFGSVDGRQMFAVPIRSGTTLVVGRPQMLFEFAMVVPVAGSRPYDVAPDGRFLIIRNGSPEGDVVANLIVVQNWFEELTRLVPPK